jgi:hypothetical protein
MRAFMKANDRDSCSPEMRRYVEENSPTDYTDMDTSGFDALKSASNNDAIDALSYAMLNDYNKKDVRMTDKMMRHASNYGTGVNRIRYGLDFSKKTLDRYNINPNMEDKMSIQINQLVADNTDNIKEAQLITKFFGVELNENSIKDKFFVRDNYKGLLKEANERQEKEDALTEKQRA